MSKIPAPALGFYDFYKTNGLSKYETEHVNNEPSMTRQEFKDECDINTIMSRYDQYLADPMRSMREPVYYDFTEMPQTLMETMAVLQTGEAAFMSLPAQVRRTFDNDPVAFVEYASDPANLDQMRLWGLAPEKPAEAFTPVGDVATSPPAKAAPEPSK